MKKAELIENNQKALSELEQWKKDNAVKVSAIQDIAATAQEGVTLKDAVATLGLNDRKAPKLK